MVLRRVSISFLLIIVALASVLPASAQDDGVEMCPPGYYFEPGSYAGEGQCVPVKLLADGSLPLYASVGGVTVSECLLYWAPDADKSTGVSLAPEKALRVTGVDMSGQYYQVVPFLFFRLWMPVECIAPNPDQYWFSMPLPTNPITTS